MIDARGLRRTFAGGVQAIDGMDLCVAQGEFVALLGPSGCGKSTFLRIVAGLDRADGGTLQLAGDNEAELRLAYVFQDAHLLPWRTVLDNVALPLELRHIGRAERQAAALAALTQVGLDDASARYPAQLSGGMRMRASLARALVSKPDLLLLDEPFAALDEISRQQLDEQLHRLWREERMTVVFVTHSIIEATFLAQRAVVLSKRPARVILDHTLSLPAERHTALRTRVEFANEMRTLFEALELGRTPARAGAT